LLICFQNRVITSFFLFTYIFSDAGSWAGM
jgi:hypothetical protein